MVSDPDATIPVPKPIPAPDAGVTPSQVGNLFVAGAGAFDTRPASSGTRGWEPPSVEVLQALLPQYEITAFLARGGMGAVYQGLQRALKRPVAIKVLPPEMVDEDDGGLQFAARFKQEAQAMARLSHPNIVAVFDAGEVVLGTTGRGGEEETLRPGEGETGREQGSGQRSEVRSQKDGPAGATLLYFVMEFIEGTDVAQLIASEGPLDAARVVPIIAAVCEALAFAHEEGIVHRDIKPSNIMIDRKGRVKVADFGLAKAVNLESTLMTRSDVAMGTPDFVAPEALIPGMKVDGRADLYALGVMLYQMLTGKIPRGRFELPSGVIPQVDHRFDAIVDRAMQTDREKRYPTATEMRREVESVGIFKDGSAGTPARISSNGGAAAKSQEAGKSARAPVVLAAAAVVVLGLGAFFITQEPTGQGKVPPPSSSTAKEAAGWSLVDLEAVRLAERGLTTAPGGWYRMTGMQTYSPFAGRMTNAGLRVEVGGRLLSGRMPEILLREQETHNYNAFLDGDGQSLVIQRYDGTVPKGHPDHYRTLGSQRLKKPVPSGSPYTLEFVAVGRRLRARINDTTLEVEAPDPPAAGLVTLYNPDFDTFRQIEQINLDGLSEAEALKAAGIEAGSPSPGLPVSPSSASTPDHAAVLRVLERGGTVTIRTSAGVTQKVTDSAALPAGTFTLEQVEVRTKSGSMSGFTDADMALLTGLPKLRRIILAVTPITGAALAVLKTLPSLKEVELDRNKALRDDDLKHLAKCPALEAVSLHHPEMFTAGVAEHLSALRQLTKLEIPELTLGSAEVKHLLRLTKLRSLSVAGTFQRAADLEQLQALPDLQTIIVSLAQLERPMSFGSFPSLTKISLVDALTSDAVKSLGTATKLEALSIDVPGRLEAAIITEIASTLKNLKNLTLTLDQPLPPGEPLAALAALPKLERVGLGQFSGINQFDDAALLSLAKVTTLKVFLLGTRPHRVTAQGIAAFQKLRPDVKIEGMGLAAAPSGPLSPPSKTDAPPTAAASSPNLPVSKSSPFPPGQWMDVTDEVRSAGIKDGTLKVNGQDLEATRKKGFILQGGRHYTDVAVRVRYAGWLALKLRQNTSAEAYGIMVQPADNPPHRPWIRMDRQMHRQGHGPELENVQLTRWLNAGLGPPEAMHDFIFAVQGTRLSVWLDGSLLGTITDDKITSPGRIELVLMSMDTKGFTTLRKVEIANLDGLSEAEALKAAGIEAAAPSPSPSWSDVTAELRSAGLANGSLKLDGDWLETVRTTWPSPAGSRLFQDFAVRITYANRVEVQFRKTAAGSYAASAEGNVCGLYVTDRSNERQRLLPVTKLTQDYDAAAPHEFLLLARGPQLSIWIDGRKQAEAADARHPEGGVSLSLFADGKPPPPRIKKVEYLLLDGLGEAEALKAAGLSSRGAEQPAGGSAAALQDGKPASSPTHPPAAWQPVTFVANAPGMEDLTVTANGGLRLNRGFTLGTFYGRNMAVRALLKRPEGVLLSGLKLRQRGPNSVSLFFGARQAWMDTVSVLPPKTPCLDLKPGQGSMTPVRLLLAAIGNQVYGRVDDTWLPPFTLSGVALEGSSAMWSMDGEFSEVQVLLMDELDETQARQAIGLTGAALPEPSAPAPAATAAWTLAYGKPLSALANSDGTRTLEYGGLKVRGGLPDVHLNSTQGMVRMGIAWMPGTRSVKLGLKGTNIELSLHESGRAELRRATHPGYEANPPGITLAKPAEQPGVELRLAWINQDVHAWAGGRYIGRQVIPSDRATSQGVWFSNDAADQEVRVTSYDIMDMKRMTPDEARKTAGVPHG